MPGLATPHSRSYEQLTRWGGVAASLGLAPQEEQDSERIPSTANIMCTLLHLNTDVLPQSRVSSALIESRQRPEWSAGVWCLGNKITRNEDKVRSRTRIGDGGMCERTRCEKKAEFSLDMWDPHHMGSASGRMRGVIPVHDVYCGKEALFCPVTCLIAIKGDGRCGAITNAVMHLE
ncbi:hypothetical protein NDU88_001957 [Pleurodeles waltl]|uniref:Uncharacterized protein n=1 Tax=Pleurodeles waltl TaxID=8319 RepID=A0AAV7P5B6_PLEWA|nr:hypothetical protein NDU88_001957 [Pleurodeles waltl]